MARRTNAERLADYEARYSELAQELAEIGLIWSGSITRRHMRCGTPGCRCHADPPELHGPYYQWTAKVRGKTITRYLSSNEVRLYREWIANDRRMRRLINQMRQVAVKAGELKIREIAAR